MDACRRDFLKRVGYAALGAGGGLALSGLAGCDWNGQPDAVEGGRQWGLVIDVQKCRSETLRRACAEACHREHNVPSISNEKQEVKWIWSEEYGKVFSDQTHGYADENLKTLPVLVLCNHCTNPPCVKVCPVAATWKRPQDGIVMMDMHRCIGCRYCMAACPYGARSFNWQDPRPHIAAIRVDYPTRTAGVVEKCNFCVERLRDGREPACIEAARAVPGGEGALAFGDLADAQSEVRRLLREKRAICRRPSLGAGPNVFYLI